MVKRKFHQSMALRMALSRSGCKESGTLSTLLLESFLEDDGRLLASKVYARGLCDENEFRKWRKLLIDKEWLVWSERQDDKGLYYPGKKLVSYINKEKILQKEIATKENIDRVKDDLSEAIHSKADRSELEETRKQLELTGKELKDAKDDLVKTKEKLTKTNEIVAKIAVAVRKMQKAKEPPITEEKLEEQNRAEQEIAENTRLLIN
jgi:hypothetical protein